MFHRHANAQLPLDQVLSSSGFHPMETRGDTRSLVAKPGQWLAQQFRAWQMQRAMNATPKDERAWQADYNRKHSS